MIETERCWLNIIQPVDFNEVKELYLDQEVRKFLGGTREEEATIENFNKMIISKDDSKYWVVRSKQASEFICLVS
ncbi:hypothetical protein [Bacillus sp. 2205SS5-2]|uniref:hypothetical protein n=1 Tax=Bacillus sp. 2205SS5-2 TaxID=3109031 RepID=UPI0030051455